MSNVDLEEVITDAVSDASLPEDTDTDTAGVEASSDTPETVAEATDTSVDSTEEVSEGVEVGSPATRGQEAAKPEQDEFEKKFGIPQQSASGRENRIPHSRVQKIVSRAEKAIEDKYAPQLKDWETKWQAQEVQNQKVAQFEEVMVNDPMKFIQTIYNNLPQYKDLLAPLFTPHAVAQNEQAPSEEVNGMPGPDLENPDGSRVYSEDGLKNLIEWAASQGETRAVQAMEQRYAPIEQSFQSYQHLQAASYKVNQEIAEAQKWPLFNENEEAITQALANDRRLSLEGAYRQVVWPKMTSDRNSIRQEVLAELKKAPSSTAAPRASNKANAPSSSSSGPRNLEDVIREKVAGIR